MSTAGNRTQNIFHSVASSAGPCSSGCCEALNTGPVAVKGFVIWNNCFRHIFGCCWRDSVKPLQYFCHTLPLSYLLDQSKLLLWKMMHVSGNILLLTLSRLVKHRFIALGDVYGVKSWDQAAIDIKTAVWHTFARNVC